MDLVPYAVPFFLVAILVEFGWGRLRGTDTYRLNDTINSLSLGTLSTAIKLLGLNLAGPVFAIAYDRLAPVHLDAASPLTWLFSLLVYDFCYYWFHRISHERTLFWASHVVHHQSEEYNLSTALRQTATGFLVSWVFYIPCFLLGVPPEVFVTVGSAHLIYQFWIHSRHIPKLGVLEWFLVTASNHRVHHARNASYVDTNYGGLLIVWDRLFGTFADERDEEPCVYGITTPLRSWNPLWANLHIYAGMLGDIRRSGSARAALRVLVSRTGWHPGEALSRAVGEVKSFSPYDPPASAVVRYYAAAQFLLAIVFSLALERAAPDMPEPLRWMSFGYLLTWLVSVGVLLEGGTRAAPLEWLRIASAPVLVLLGANSWPALSGAAAYALVSGVFFISALRGAGTKAPGAAGNSGEAGGREKNPATS